MVATLPPIVPHSTMNHSLHFVDPAIGTQHILCYWARAKYSIKGMKGYTAQEIPSYLDEFM